jgi:hypothetical protein
MDDEFAGGSLRNDVRERAATVYPKAPSGGWFGYRHASQPHFGADRLDHV